MTTQNEHRKEENGNVYVQLALHCWLKKGHEGPCKPSNMRGPCSHARTYICGKVTGYSDEWTLIGKVDAPGLSFTVKREKAPLYKMDACDPSRYPKPRSIAGSMIFLTFDRTALLEGIPQTRWQKFKSWARRMWRKVFDGCEEI